MFFSDSFTMIRKLPYFLLASGALVLPHELQADVKEDIGFNQLEQVLGPLMPTGATVKVGLVEANIDRDLDNSNFPVDGQYDFVPNTDDPQFMAEGAEKLFLFQSGEGDTSSHATSVGKRFFGSTTSISPGIQDVGLYFADRWLTVDYLNGNSQLLPDAAADVRIFNHSWVGEGDAGYLARTDWVVEQLDTLQVVGVNNSNNGGARTLLASAYNTISVGLSSGRHEAGNTAPSSVPGLDIYSSLERTKPDLVVPESFTSFATPYVSGAAALLVETAHDNPGLSRGFRELTQGTSYTVYHGETSEVIKSMLMSGADREFAEDYRAAPYVTTNGLDSRFGAGQLNIYNSHQILTGGEQNSLEEGGPANVGLMGFDYDPDFSSDDVASYIISTGAYEESLAASLVWNLDVDLELEEGQIDYSAVLADFDLYLYEKNDGVNELVASSASVSENTENIWLTNLPANSEFLLEVRRDDGLDPWDYGLSWRRDLIDLLAGDADVDGDVDLSDFQALKDGFGLSFGAARANGDLDIDGDVDLNDFQLLKSSFGSNLATNSEPESSPAPLAVPEPATIWLAMGLLPFWLARNSRRSFPRL